MYLDFCKAFDLVQPDILIMNGECYKIIAAKIKWISNSSLVDLNMQLRKIH